MDPVQNDKKFYSDWTTGQISLMLFGFFLFIFGVIELGVGLETTLFVDNATIEGAYYAGIFAMVTGLGSVLIVFGSGPSALLIVMYISTFIAGLVGAIVDWSVTYVADYHKGTTYDTSILDYIYATCCTDHLLCSCSVWKR
jgi:hypothetical protein